MNDKELEERVSWIGSHPKWLSNGFVVTYDQVFIDEYVKRFDADFKVNFFGFADSCKELEKIVKKMTTKI